MDRLDSVRKHIDRQIIERRQRDSDQKTYQVGDGTQDDLAQWLERERREIEALQEQNRVDLED